MKEFLHYLKEKRWAWVKTTQMKSAGTNDWPDEHNQDMLEIKIDLLFNNILRQIKLTFEFENDFEITLKMKKLNSVICNFFFSVLWKCKKVTDLYLVQLIEHLILQILNFLFIYFLSKYFFQICKSFKLISKYTQKFQYISLY